MEKGTPNRERKRHVNGGDAALEDLFSNVGARPEPRDDDRRRVREAVRAEWQAIARGRRWRRRAAGFAVAAAVVLTVALALLRTGPRVPAADPVEMARVEKLSGIAWFDEVGSKGNDGSLAEGMTVYVGQSISTGSRSGIALRLESGMSLRVDAQTELRLVDAHSLGLETGRLYIDTHGGGVHGASTGDPGRIAVLTRRGTVRHVGTQFMVRMGEERLQVDVRSGSVRFDAVDLLAMEPLEVSQGQALSVDEEGQRELAPTDVNAAQWRWAEELGAGFVLDGRTMAEFLAWVGSETGREIVYVSERARSVAEETRLHGKVDLPARRALDVVLMSTDLTAHTRGGAIEIRMKP